MDFRPFLGFFLGLNGPKDTPLPGNVEPALNLLENGTFFVLFAFFELFSPVF